jgi:predicted GTPase
MREFTQEAVRARLDHIREAVIPEMHHTGQNGRVTAILEKWEPHLKKIDTESQQRPEVVISLVGGTGAGKSTLLNALLDARILPVSNMRACTAAITEVAYSPDGRYHAIIEFMARNEWQKEIDVLKDDLRDFLEMQAAKPGSSEGPSDEAHSISRVARDKLKTVYSLPEDFQFTLETLETLHEDREIATALDGQNASIATNDLKEFRDRIKLYLDSKQKFWPIVTKVIVSGPFDILKDGVRIVDLPGINDPNQAREAVTHNYLKTCDFVWIVFNIKRVITKDTMALMQSDDFMRQILMDGRTHALTFVGTASDDIDAETACEEFGLDEATPEPAIILHRNQEVRKEVKKQLEDVATRMVQLAQEDGERLSQLTQVIRSPAIFTVSAREYMALRHLSLVKSPKLDAVPQTEVDILKLHLGRICESYGVEAQARSHHHHLDLFARELEREISLTIESLEKRSEISQRQRQEVERAVDTARKFLLHDLQSIKEFYSEHLEASQRLLRERLERGFERGTHDLVNLASRWQGMHWATLRAVARRGGRFVGASGTHDFSRDIAEPVLNTIMFAWADFFGDQMTMSLDGVREKLLTAFNRELNTLVADSMRIIKIEEHVRKAFERMSVTSEVVLKEHTGQVKTEMLEKINRTQKTLYEQIGRQIHANMQAAYDQAANERGAGMKLRMVKILADHARDVAGVMFEDARREITEGIRSLCDYLVRKYDQMKTTVIDQSKLAESNLLLDSEVLSPDDLQARKLGLEQCISVLAQA